MDTGWKVSLGGHAALLLVALIGWPFANDSQSAAPQVVNVTLVTTDEEPRVGAQTPPRAPEPVAPRVDEEVAALSPPPAPRPPEPPARPKPDTAPRAKAPAPLEPDRPGFEVIRQVEQLIRSSGLLCEGYRDLRPVQWSKLIFNSAVNAIGAVTNTPHAPYYANTDQLADLGNLVRNMMAEGVAIARAKGIELSGDPWEMNCRAVRQGGSDEGSAAYAHVTSMLDDVRNRRPTEVDWITGSLVRAAREVGVAAPYHETLYRLVKAIELGWSQQPADH